MGAGWASDEGLARGGGPGPLVFGVVVTPRLTLGSSVYSTRRLCAPLRVYVGFHNQGRQ